MNVAAPSTQGVPLSASDDSLALLFSSGNLLELLVAIRGSSMPDEQKLTVRDLVLEYTQLQDEGKQSALQQQIVETLSPFAKEFAFLSKQNHTGTVATPDAAIASSPTPEPVSVPDTSGDTRKFNPITSGRVAPTFKVKQVAPPSETPSSQTESVRISIPTQAPKSEPSTPTPTPAPEPAPTPTPEAQAPLPSPEPVAVPDAGATARIKEIKSSVNSRVGNPINLIDVDNEVGREYMNALLGAMKKSTAGDDAGGLIPAMERLEKAYQAVGQVIAEKGDEIGKEHHEQAPAPASTPEPSAPTTPAPTPPKPPKPESEPQVNSIPVQPKPEPSVSTAPEPQTSTPKLQSVGQQQKPSPETPAAQKQPAQPKSVPQPPPVEEPLVKQTTSALQHLTSRLRSGQSSRPSANDQVPPIKSNELPTEIPGSPVQSVARTQTLPKQMATLKQAVADKEAAANRELGEDVNSQEVTAGLEQLLSEWSLFKSSGFLGVGPNGIDHPLYIKMAKLPMAAIIAGRFEGATLEVKHNIGDYMNGWRYERGMVHEMGETFEHYLRRVVLNILKLQRRQKKKDTA